MKNGNEFFAWIKSQLGYDETATPSEVQQALIDTTPAPQAVEQPAEVAIEQIEATVSTDNATVAAMEMQLESINEKLEKAEILLAAAQTRIAELEQTPAAEHTNGPDDLDDDRPKASADKELVELGNILKNSMRMYN